MTNVDNEALVAAYLQDLLSGAEIVDATNWAWEALQYLIFEDPEVAWVLILEVARRSIYPIQLTCLGAGALESLLRNHPEQFIDRVEAEVAKDDKFGKALGHSNVSSIDDAALRSRYAAAGAVDSNPA